MTKYHFVKGKYSLNRLFQSKFHKRVPVAQPLSERTGNVARHRVHLSMRLDTNVNHRRMDTKNDPYFIRLELSVVL